MSWWNAKYKNNHGEYEITFGTKYYERAKAIEKVCKAVIDKLVKTPEDMAVVVHCKDCKFRKPTFSGADYFCTVWDADESETAYVTDNDFCSYGERREDKHETD